MSLSTFLFSFPFYYTSRCYSSLFFDPPMEKETDDDYKISQSKIIENSNHRYHFLLEAKLRKDIKNEIKEFMHQQGIRKDLIFIELPPPYLAAATGTNISPYGTAAVFLRTKFYETDKDACNFAIKHEISHIKHNDAFTMSFVPLVCQLAAAIFGLYYLSFSYAVRLAVTAGFISNSLFSVWREEKADDFAIENSSNEELKGARRLFIAMQEIHIKLSDTFLGSILITPDGENRLDFEHPSLKSRIQKIEKALASRNVFISIKKERQKINEKLKPYILKNIS